MQKREQKSRFLRWRASLPQKAAFLVGLVVAELIPEFEKNRFVWDDDFAPGNRDKIGDNEIPLRRREDGDWPTVQIRFDRHGRPFFHIFFAALPPICKSSFGTEDVLREVAVVSCAPAFFSLRKGRRSGDDGMFGFAWFALSYKRRLRVEVQHAKSLLPALFALFDEGIPRDWLTRSPGRVGRHVQLHGSWHHDATRRLR